MNPDLEKLFDQAVSLTGTERAEFIARNCPDPGLHRELELRDVAGLRSRRCNLFARRGDGCGILDVASSRILTRLATRPIAVAGGLVQGTPLFAQYLTDLRKSDQKALQHLSR